MLDLVLTLVVANSAPGAVPAAELAPAIRYAANRHGVDPVLLARIVMVESRGVANAYNAKSQDHGLLQVNERTRRAYGFSHWCMQQWQCSLDAGAIVLRDLLKMRDSRPCTYNVGPRGRLPQYETVCEKYEAKLAAM